MKFEARLSYYRGLIFERFISGKITEEKYERLVVKLDEWAAYSHRKEGSVNKQ